SSYGLIVEATKLIEPHPNCMQEELPQGRSDIYLGSIGPSAINDRHAPHGDSQDPDRSAARDLILPSMPKANWRECFASHFGPEEPGRTTASSRGAAASSGSQTQ